MRLIFDTNFILSAVKQKIDLPSQARAAGFMILIPKQVINELEGIVHSKKKGRDKEKAELALFVLKENRFEIIDLRRDIVDDGIVRYTEIHKGVAVATLDRALRKRLKGVRLVTLRKNKGLEFG